jgi:ABC-type sugar transport system substrate-binding protein
MENNNPWSIAETKSMQAEAEMRAAKYDIVITDAQGQTAKQVSDVEDLVAFGAVGPVPARAWKDSSPKMSRRGTF